MRDTMNIVFFLINTPVSFFRAFFLASEPLGDEMQKTNHELIWELDEDDFCVLFDDLLDDSYAEVSHANRK